MLSDKTLSDICVKRKAFESVHSNGPIRHFCLIYFDEVFNQKG